MARLACAQDAVGVVFERVIEVTHAAPTNPVEAD